MDFRKAVMRDLPQLKDMYKRIVKDMKEQNIQIWDDIYPCEFFEDDIKNNQLYILLNNGEIVAAFVLSNTNLGETAVKWNDNHAKAVYIDRLGVNVKYSKKGIGSLMLDKAKEVAQNCGAEYLRLFVVDINVPAIHLYIKNGFIRANGIYDEVIDKDLVLHEYGFEAAL